MRDVAEKRAGISNQRSVNTPHKKTLKLFEGLSTHYMSILVQMRSMQVGLKASCSRLAGRFRQVHCFEWSQMPQFVLLQCPLRVDERKSTMDNIRAWTDLDQQALMVYDALLSLPLGIAISQIQASKGSPRQSVPAKWSRNRNMPIRQLARNEWYEQKARKLGMIERTRF